MDYVQRYGRAARWFHAFVYVVMLILLSTGWWFVLDNYQDPLLGLPDGDIHEWTGLLFVLVTLIYVVGRVRAARAFVRESLEREPGDARWLAAWPKAALTGRFPRHEGHYDPGQRLANLVMLATLAALALTGLGMLYLPSILLMADLHRWTTFLLTPVLAGHVLVAAGLLPGYRGVWRSMHLGGHLPRPVAARIWPGWLARQDSDTPAEPGRPTEPAA
ncbi:cytochrome b/b6 domain-containing protein [Sphaerisporangium aureirubrum]|uniref:Cytochrome b/b6 domain-containing protein n=1 Tax=Sphaerisporangium aureirubrum TaxID=1544736 RepID=A0ABW1NTS7_9ACTN